MNSTNLKQLNLSRPSLLGLAAVLSMLAPAHAQSSSYTESVTLASSELDAYSSSESRKNILVPSAARAIYANRVQLCASQLEEYPTLYFGILDAQTTGAEFSESTVGSLDISAISAATGIKIDKSHVADMTIGAVQATKEGVYLSYSEVGNLDISAVRSSERGIYLDCAEVGDITLGSVDTSKEGLYLFDSEVGNLNLGTVKSSSKGVFIQSSNVGTIRGSLIHVERETGHSYGLNVMATGYSVGFDQAALQSNPDDQGTISINIHAISEEGNAYGVFAQDSGAKIGALRGKVHIYTSAHDQQNAYAWYGNDSHADLKVLADGDTGSCVATYGNIISKTVHVDSSSYLKLADVGQTTVIDRFDIDGRLDIVMSHEVKSKNHKLNIGKQGIEGAENIRVFGGVLNAAAGEIVMGDILHYGEALSAQRDLATNENSTLVFDAADGEQMVMSFDVNSDKGVSITQVKQVETDAGMSWDIDLTMNEGDAFMMSVYVGGLLAGLDSSEYDFYHLNENGERVDLNSACVSYFEGEGMLHFSVDHDDTTGGTLSGPLVLATAGVLPEPSSVMLSLLGLAGMCWRRRRE